MARKKKQLYQIKNELFVDLNLTLKVDVDLLGLYPETMSESQILEILFKEINASLRYMGGLEPIIATGKIKNITSKSQALPPQVKLKDY